jgi:hypothetical protein
VLAEREGEQLGLPFRCSWNKQTTQLYPPSRRLKI